MSAQVSDWLLAEIRKALAADEGTSVMDALPVVRSYCSMKRLLEAVVESADLERAA